MAFEKNTRVCVPPFVYYALKYFTEKMTPRTFSNLLELTCLIVFFLTATFV